MYGASWSLCKETAERFPFLNRYRVPSPLIVTATVRKNEIIALKRDRGEDEIITLYPEIEAVEAIPEERGVQLLTEWRSCSSISV